MTPGDKIQIGECVTVSISRINCQHCSAMYSIVMGDMIYQGSAYRPGDGNFVILEFVNSFRCPHCLGYVDVIGLHQDAEVNDDRTMDGSTGLPAL